MSIILKAALYGAACAFLYAFMKTAPMGDTVKALREDAKSGKVPENESSRLISQIYMNRSLAILLLVAVGGVLGAVGGWIVMMVRGF